MEDRLPHHICLPHSHDCPIIVNKKRKLPLWILHHDNEWIPSPAIALCCPYCTFHMPFLFREASTFIIPQSRLPLLFRRAHLSYFAIWTVLFWTRACPQPVTWEPNVSTKPWRLIEGKPDWMMTDEINEVEKTEDVDDMKTDDEQWTESKRTK